MQSSSVAEGDDFADRWIRLLVVVDDGLQKLVSGEEVVFQPIADDTVGVGTSFVPDDTGEDRHLAFIKMSRLDLVLIVDSEIFAEIDL